MPQKAISNVNMGKAVTNNTEYISAVVTWELQPAEQLQ